MTSSTFPSDLELNKTTVIYGHNGSGKSSLSDLLLDVSEGNSPNGLVAHSDEQGKFDSKNLSDKNPLNISVFNGTWVRRELGSFVEGENADAIVTLDQTATTLKTELDALVLDLPDLAEALDKQNEKLKVARKRRADVLSDTQSDIVNDLDSYLPGKFTRSKYRVTRVEQLLSETDGVRLSDAEGRSNRQLIATDAMHYFRVVDAPPPEVPDMHSTIARLRQETPTSLAIDALVIDSDLEDWVGRGLELHSASGGCKFCGGNLEEGRVEELRNHFDDSRKSLRAAIAEEIGRVDAAAGALSAYRDEFPDPEIVNAIYRTEYEQDLARLEGTVADLRSYFLRCNNLLREKILKLDQALNSEEFSAPELLPDDYLGSLMKSNATSQNIDGEKSSAANAILADLVAGRRKEFAEADQGIAEAEKEAKLASSALATANGRIEAIRQESFTSAEAAEAISTDLEAVYGKGHLSIEAVGDEGLSYRCVRDGKPARFLSEGEKNTLALVYFIHREILGAESGERAGRVLVIDDPTSSFDRETTYATHGWLLGVIRKFGQAIIMTHDFELLRLFLHSLSSRATGSEDDAEYGAESSPRTGSPNVNTASFYELRAVAGAAPRTSALSKLSKTLVSSKSEYSYIFELLATSVVGDEDDASFFAAPNAARRTLETFCAFKAPNQGNFLSRLEYAIESTKRNKLITPSDIPVDFRALYDFCNRFSHGQASLLGASLDSVSTRRELRNCLAFIRACDELHYWEMLRSIASITRDPLTGGQIPKAAAVAGQMNRRVRDRVRGELVNNGAFSSRGSSNRSLGSSGDAAALTAE